MDLTLRLKIIFLMEMNKTEYDERIVNHFVYGAVILYRAFNWMVFNYFLNYGTMANRYKYFHKSHEPKRRFACKLCLPVIVGPKPYGNKITSANR